MSTTREPGLGSDTHVRPALLWAGLGAATFVAGMALAYRPSLDTDAGVVLAVLPWVLLAAGAVAFADVSTPVRAVALGVVLVAWAVLLLDNDAWSVLSFGVYLLCYTFDNRRPLVGISLSGVATAVWIGAWTLSDNPPWVVLLPGFVFIAASTLSVAMHRTGAMAEEQAALAAQLRATRDELAESERSRGVLEERARMAGEIHDTLAQGFTSIVLLARTGQHGEPTATLASIESAAEHYLAEARRIVRAAQPRELEGRSLHDALARHVETSLPQGPQTTFRVVGEPVTLTGDVVVTLLRATQEGLRNVDAHAQAGVVDVTLSYLDDVVALDVRDDGIGFTPGQVNERGTLTGGQGLESLARRAEALLGTLTIESEAGEGSVLSLQLPASSS